MEGVRIRIVRRGSFAESSAREMVGGCIESGAMMNESGTHRARGWLGVLLVLRPLRRRGLLARALRDGRGHGVVAVRRLDRARARRATRGHSPRHLGAPARATGGLTPVCFSRCGRPARVSPWGQSRPRARSRLRERTDGVRYSTRTLTLAASPSALAVERRACGTSMNESRCCCRRF